MERSGAAYLVGKIISEEHPTRIRLPPISTELCLCEQRYFSKTIRSSMSSALRCLFIVLICNYKSARLSGHQSKPSNAELDSALGKVRIAVVVLPVLLVTGLWVTRREPLLPRLTGAAINLLITVWLIILLRKAKKKVDSA
jgi:hypothetical protein